MTVKENVYACPSIYIGYDEYEREYRVHFRGDVLTIELDGKVIFRKVKVTGDFWNGRITIPEVNRCIIDSINIEFVLDKPASKPRLNEWLDSCEKFQSQPVVPDYLIIMIQPREPTKKELAEWEKTYEREMKIMDVW